MKTNIEDGYFTTQEPISEEEKEELEAGYDLTLEKQQYVDLEYHDTKLRLHTQTQNVDLYTISEGRDIESGDELVLTYNYAKANGIAVGDKLKLAGREFTVCGLGMKSDYAIMLYDLSETIPNKSGFGIGIITKEAMAEPWHTDGVLFGPLQRSGTGACLPEGALSEKVPHFQWKQRKAAGHLQYPFFNHKRVPESDLCHWNCDCHALYCAGRFL